MSEEIKEKKKKKRGGFLNYIIGGQFLTSELVTRNALLLGLIILYAFVYVSIRYEYEQDLIKIDRLTKERNELKNNLLTLESEFSYSSRQTELEKFLNENNSELKITTRPPYKINK